MMMNEEQLRSLSPQDLAGIGADKVAYVKPIVVDGKKAYAIHGADGTPLTVAGSLEVAYAVIRQNDLEPMAAH
ncbi:MAG: DUF1150 family protein [Azospirillaceae bacterium]